MKNPKKSPGSTKARLVSTPQKGAAIVTERIVRMVKRPTPMPSRMVGWTGELGPLAIKDGKPDPELPALFRLEQDARGKADAVVVALQSENKALRNIIRSKETQFLVLKHQKEHSDSENAGLRADLEATLIRLGRGV